MAESANKIQRALISVSDKSGICELAKSLVNEFDIEIISTGGTLSALLEENIPAIDIIDFDYPYWHTLEDTPDKCSAKTLGIVGTVVSEYLYLKDLR